MPSSITVSHNGLDITFTESDHSYIDSNNKKYTSVTTLVGMGFEKFDGEVIAKRKAEREGLNWQDLLKSWDEAGKRACEAGTRLHENCEHQLLGQNTLIHEARDIKEKINFDLARKAVDDIKSNYHNIKFEPEKLVFSPKLGLAGSIDLLVTQDIPGRYIIYDWKNVKGISSHGFNGKTGIIEATKDVQDSNYWHYNLQLQIYEIILKVERYIPKDAIVTRILNVFENGKFNQYELPSIGKPAKDLILYNLNLKKNLI